MSEPRDVRRMYYERYVSAFTSRDPIGRPASDEGFWAWCDQHLGRWIADAPKGDRVLELGCGGGAALEYLKKRGFAEVEGIDISEEQIELARDRGVPARMADAFGVLEDLESELGAVLALDFVEHFSKAELALLLSRIWTALKPGGTLVLRTPNGQGLFPGSVVYGDLTHVTILNPISLRQALHTAGFVNVSITEAGPAKKGFRGWTRAIAWGVIRTVVGLIYRIETGKKQTIWTENMVCVARRPFA